MSNQNEEIKFAKDSLHYPLSHYGEFVDSVKHLSYVELVSYPIQVGVTH